MRLGDGVISREDMFLDLRRENITVNYVQGERHLRDILERDWMTSLTTYGLETLVRLGKDWTRETKERGDMYLKIYK